MKPLSGGLIDDSHGGLGPPPASAMPAVATTPTPTASRLAPTASGRNLSLIMQIPFVLKIWRRSACFPTLASPQQPAEKRDGEYRCTGDDAGDHAIRRGTRKRGRCRAGWGGSGRGGRARPG